MTSQNFSFTSGEFFGDGDAAVVDDSYGTSGSNGVWRWDIIAGGTRYDTGSGWSIDYTHSTGVWRVKKPNELESAFRSQTADSNGVVTFPPDSGTLNLCVFTESSAFSSFPASGGGGGGGGFLNVNAPYVTWIYADRPCGQTAYVSVTNTESTNSASTYTLHDTELGQIGTITVGTGSTASANVAFTISARTLHVKDSNSSILPSGTRVFTCGVKKACCNFW